MMCPAQPAAPFPPAPATRREGVVQQLHGTEVADPYRWLEDTESVEVAAWTAAQNARTRAYLERIPGRAALEARLQTLYATGSVTTPSVRGDGYWYTRRAGTQNQPVLLRRKGVHGTDRVAIDPNLLNAAGTTSLDWFHPSDDGALVAYGLSEGGDEKSTLRIRDEERGADLPDEIPFTRACSVAWLPDGSGFYFTRYPEPGTVPAGDEFYNRRVYFHALGRDWHSDELVFGEGRDAQEWPSVSISPQGRWLVVSASQGWARNELFLLDRAAPSAVWQPLAAGIEALFDAEVLDDRIYIRTNDGAPNWRLFVVNPERPERSAWRELIPEGTGVLDAVRPFGHTVTDPKTAPWLLVHRLEKAVSRLQIYSAQGVLERDVALPGLGAVTALSGRRDGDEAFFGFTSFAIPATIYRVGREGFIEEWANVPSPVDPQTVEVTQETYRSKDGTPVTLFLVGLRDTPRDSPRPTILSGYGGFNLPVGPAFLPRALAWIEHGGRYALANLRGGSEYGEAWHRGGMLGNKQNVFDDFAAAALWLLERRLTTREQLGILGGSNGGLLVGAALTQHPELFSAVACMVPLLDMLRYHHFRIAKLWIPEYGSADDAAQFQWLYAYSPYHRVRRGVGYPATLLTTAEGDSRVDPMHARKMAALLQEATASPDERPILLRVETQAGHGAGKPVSKQVAEAADVLGFLFWQLAGGYQAPVRAEDRPPSG